MFQSDGRDGGPLGVRVAGRDLGGRVAGVDGRTVGVGRAVRGAVQRLRPLHVRQPGQCESGVTLDASHVASVCGRCVHVHVNGRGLVVFGEQSKHLFCASVVYAHGKACGVCSWGGGGRKA